MNIIIGSGRCGTFSVAKLLNGVHELTPLLAWKQNKEQFQKHLKKMKAMDNDTFVAFYYLNYIEDLRKEFGEINTLALKREKKATVNSFMGKTKGYNHWKDHGGEYEVNAYEHCFPNYGDIPKRQAIAKYWEEYYKRVEDKGIKTIEMKKLNSEKGQKEIFNHLGKKYKGFKKVHYNKS